MIKEILAEKELQLNSFKPFSIYEDREDWLNLSEEVKTKYITGAEKYLGYKWPRLLATAYLEFSRNGNRSNYEVIHGDIRLGIKLLMFAECFEGKGRFIDDLINGIWALCEESSWVIPAHNNHFQGRAYRALPDIEEEVVYIDLFSAEAASLLTWVHYFLKKPLDKESPLICRRIKYEINKRIIDPFLKWDQMDWMGFYTERVNNWNPWILSNILTVFLALEDDEEKRRQGIHKCLLSLDNFIKGYTPDGGCDEGANYWTVAGASLFDCLELVFEATNGDFSIYDNELIKNIGRYIQRAHISDSYYVNFADGAPKIKINCELVSRYGKRIGDTKLEDFGAAMFSSDEFIIQGDRVFYREIKAIINYKAIKEKGEGKVPPTAGDVWLDGIQFMVARENPENTSGFFVAAKGGHNAESHNHNDIGNFIIYYNGAPVFIDPGCETYTAKTFSPHRYEIWTMQSSFHNLPEINRYMQMNGREYNASNVNYQASTSGVKLSMNLEGAYPREAGLEKWERLISLKRQGEVCVNITDTFALKEASDNIIFNYITYQLPEIRIPGEIVLITESGSEVLMVYNSSLVNAEIQAIELEDPKIKGDWSKEGIYGLKLKLINETKYGTFNIMLKALK